METKKDELKLFVHDALIELVDRLDVFEDENTLKLVLECLVRFELIHNGISEDIDKPCANYWTWTQYVVDYWLAHPNEKLHTVIYRSYNSAEKHEKAFQEAIDGGENKFELEWRDAEIRIRAARMVAGVTESLIDNYIESLKEDISAQAVNLWSQSEIVASILKYLDMAYDNQV